MRFAHLYDVDRIEIEETDIPDLSEGELLIQTRACGICTSDLRESYVRSKSYYMFGHEPVGTVARTGGSTSEFSVGDRVFVHHHAPCMKCRHCIRGEFVHCKTWRNSNIDPGGMAEFFRVPATNSVDILPLPDNVSDADGTLIEPVGCALKALEKAGIRPGDCVLVIGLGFMGQLLAKLAPTFGAANVLGSDPDPSRRQMAVDLGIGGVIDPGTGPTSDQVRSHLNGQGADVVIVGPPMIETIREGIRSAGPGSRVVLFSSPSSGERFNLEPHDLYYREVSLISSYSCGPLDTRRALALICAGVLSSKELVTHQFPFEDVARAYATMRQGGPAVKAVVHFTK